MKKIVIFIASILIVGAIGGYWYWSIHKKSIIKDAVQNAVKSGSDSLYRIRYDSSSIDELTGTASFYGVRLQSDDYRKQVLSTTDSLPNALFLVKIAEVTARGVDIPGLLQKRNVAATSISIIKPVIQIINTGADKPKPFTYKDTLQLYERILGDFSSINADTIRIVDGTLLMTNKDGKALTTVENINVNLRQFKIDSNRNYQNLISYFIKDVNVSVANIQLPETEKNTRVNITHVVYDAPGRTLQIGAIQQYKTGNSKALVDLNKIRFTGLNTDAFILQNRVQAEAVNCEGGLVTIYNRKKKRQTANAEEQSLELSSDFIDAVQIKALQTGKLNIVINNADDPNAPPFVINDVVCNASNINPVTNGSTLSTIISDADWQISAAGFSFVTKAKMYDFKVSNINVSSDGTLRVQSVALKPVLPEEAFAAAMKIQMDRYDFVFNQLQATGFNVKKLLANNLIEMRSLTVTPIMRIYNDRTRDPGPVAGAKPFPYQALLELPLQLFVESVQINNGAVYYKERGETSTKTGMPFFTAINGSLKNVTNIPARIAQNGQLSLNTTALFLGKGKLKTSWTLPLRKTDSVFAISGQMGSLDVGSISAVTEPLAMVSLKKGKVNSLDFSFKGTNHKGYGQLTLLYSDLKADVLKLKDDQLKKKGLMTIVANTLIKNGNPQNGQTRVSEISHEHDSSKSFFNLVWKSIFSGVKNAALGK